MIRDAYCCSILYHLLSGPEKLGRKQSAKTQTADTKKATYVAFFTFSFLISVRVFLVYQLRPIAPWLRLILPGLSHNLTQTLYSS